MFFQPFAADAVKLSDAELLRRRNDNRRYMMSLSSENLLLNFTHEAGLRLSFNSGEQAGMHGGWESPSASFAAIF